MKLVFFCERKACIGQRNLSVWNQCSNFWTICYSSILFPSVSFFRRYYFHSWVSNHISCLQWTLLNYKPVQCKSLKKPAKSIQFPLALNGLLLLRFIKSPVPPFPAGSILPKNTALLPSKACLSSIEANFLPRVHIKHFQTFIFVLRLQSTASKLWEEALVE